MNKLNNNKLKLQAQIRVMALKMLIQTNQSASTVMIKTKTDRRVRAQFIKLRTPQAKAPSPKWRHGRASMSLLQNCQIDKAKEDISQGDPKDYTAFPANH